MCDTTVCDMKYRKKIMYYTRVNFRTVEAAGREMLPSRRKALEDSKRRMINTQTKK